MLHGLCDQRFHLIEFFGRWSTINVAENGFANLGSTNVSTDIKRSANFFQPLEILIQGGPVDLQMVPVQLGLELSQCASILRSNRSALTSDFSCYALRKLAQRAVVDEQIEFRLTEHVDKARRDNQARSIDDTIGLSIVKLANGGDAVAANRYVAGSPWISRSIDDPSVLNDHIVSRIGLCS